MSTGRNRVRSVRVHAENFRSLREMDLDLGDLTVLVGRNGAGKSNTVDALRFVRDSVVEGVERALSLRGGAGTILRGDSQSGAVVLEVDVEGRRTRTEVKISTSDDSYLHWFYKSEEKNEWFDLSDVDDSTAFREMLDVVSSIADDMKSKSRRRRHIGNRQYVWVRARGSVAELSSYDFVPRGLRAPQRVMKPSPLLEDGENLTSTLRDVIGGSHADALRASLRALVDGVEDIEVTPAAGHLVAELIYRSPGGAASRYDLGLESDGTIRLVAILAALYQSPPRALTVIEEPERNIHPGALVILADVIKEASTRGQVLITTHSPDLIDHFDADAIRVVERVDGATTVGPMDETQREAVRSGLFSTGELLRMEGLNRQDA